MTDPTVAQGKLAGLSREQRALLFEQLRKRKEGGGKPEGIPRRAADLDPPPVSFAQERLWLIDRLQPGLTAYNVPVALRVTGDLAPDLLASALNEVVRRHEALRTTFREVGGQPVQVIAPEQRIDLVRVDLTFLDAAEREDEARRQAAVEVERPFDLARGPLLRAVLLQLSSGEQVLLLTLHHIVSDGWSMGVLVREVTTLYAAAAASRPSPLPPLPIQYSDYAVWQRRHLTGERLERQLAYWRERLAGVPAVLELPADRPRPAVPTYRGGRLRAVLDSTLTRELSLLARRHEASLFMVLLAGFQALLGRLSGQRDLAVGSPIANRHRTEVEPLIGFFVNTLVLRAELGGDPTFGELVDRTRRGTLGAYEHQDLPFERLVEELRPERHLAVNPLFQVSCAMQNAPVGAIELPGLAIAPFEQEATSSQFDLDLNVWESEGSLLALFGYSGELFDTVTVRRFAHHLETLLRGALGSQGEGRRLSELSLLTDGELQQLRREWSAGEPESWHGAAPALVSAQAHRTPEALAIMGSEGRISYGDLEADAERLACRLRRLGVGPETIVAVSAERTPETIVALLAVWKAGGAYLPLDPAYPAARLHFMLADSGARWLLADGALAETARAWDVEIVPVVQPERAESVDGEIARSSAPNDLAYVLYTSGSTGQPKGVAVSHGSLANLLDSVGYAPGLAPDDAFLAVASLSFDIAGVEVWLPLVTGARVVLATRDEAADGRRLRSRIEEEGATVVQGTPATFRLLLDAGWQGGERSRALCCGEAFPPDLASRLLERCGAVWNLYGPTETTIFSSGGEVRSVAGPLVPIGRPVGGTRLHVVDAEGFEVPIGVAGELLIGGAGLARGYLGRPDLTAERFVPDPFSEQPGERLYRSGDLARYRPDGRLDCLGRIDGQVKLRGFRIELGEIESALVREDGLLRAAVALRGEGEARRLVAWVVRRPEAAPIEGGSIRAALRRSLPEPMIPGQIVEVEALPLTPSGKVDLKALPEVGAAPAGEAYLAPRDGVEEALAAVWAGLLQVEQVGIHDNFFELGGHSLMGSRALADLRDSFGVELPLRTLFDRPTIAGLAVAVGEARSRIVVGEGPGVERIERQPRTPGAIQSFPVSASQLREWLLERLLPGAGAYNIPGASRILGPLDVARLARALRDLVLRHESLRTSFAESAGGGEPMQVIAPELEVELPLADLSALPPLVRAGEVRRLSHLVSQVTFDLARPPLLRVWLLRLAERGRGEEGEHLLLFTLHHILSDGWSMGVFFRELAELYVAATEGRTPRLPPLPVQYADYAVWQRQRLEGEGLQPQIERWRERLAGVPSLDLPADQPRPAVQRFEGARHPFALSPGVSAGLEALAGRRGASPFMVLLSAFAALLARYTGQDDFAVGTFAGNRNRAELEGVIGFFINSLVLRLGPRLEMTFDALLAEAREVTLSAFADQDVPFERLLEALDVRRDLSRTPLFQVLLVFQTFPAAAVEVSEVRLEPLAVENDHSDFDLSLWLSPGAEGIAGYFNHAVRLFERATIARLAGHLGSLLAGAVAKPDLALADLPLLADAERKQLLDWSEGAGALAAEGGVVRVEDLFAAQAARDPAAPALEWERSGLSYGELEARVESLALRLRAQGVGPEARVGLAVERSPEMIVALLAVLRAGGAYLPLDPAFPEARLAAMIADSGLALILTQRALAPTLPKAEARLLILDAEPDAADDKVAARPPERGNEVRHAAYVIYTSGSTGKPKGVVVEHRSLGAYTRGAVAAFGLGPGDRVLQFASISFDASAEEIYPALASGATLVLRPAEMAASVAHFLREVERLRITVLDLPTAFWHELVAGLGTEGPLPACVRLVILGGERALPERVAQWRSKVGPQVRLLNTYGPTEATIVSTRIDITEGTDSAPIGRPVPGARVHVLDRLGGMVPVGVPGELYVGGAGLARGYLRRPEITAERFVPDPFVADGSRLYCTGDLVRWLFCGDLEFVGRVDHQVKVRGFRIELGEVETALRAHPALRDAVVVLSGGDDPRLVAYSVGAASEGEPTPSAPTPAELRTFLRERLPEFMIPSHFVAIPALPLTPSGKLDRRALPAPETARAEAGAAFEAPRSELERTIAGVWRELLGVETVGRNDNFFDLGAHSLLLVRAHARLREALGRELSVVDLFRHPSVGALARHLGSVGSGEEKPSFREVKTLAEQQKAALGRQRQAQQARLRKGPGGPPPGED